MRYVDAAHCYRLSSVVCRSVTVMSPAKTAESIEMPFGIWTRVGPRKHALGRGANWRHLANITEPSMCSSGTACCQITLTTCLALQLTILYVCTFKGNLVFLDLILGFVFGDYVVFWGLSNSWGKVNSMKYVGLSGLIHREHRCIICRIQYTWVCDKVSRARWMLSAEASV